MIASHHDVNNLALTKAKFPEKHSGLQFDKYFNRWTVSTDYQDWSIGNPDDKSSEKLAWLNDFIKQYNYDKALSESYLKRQKRLVETQGGQSQTFKSSSAFVTGLGRNHPLENGFLWHHTLAVPYLAASSIKGMTRAYLEHWADETVDINNLFGSANDNHSQAGSIIFMDAVAETFTLKAHIINPHYSDYYQEKTDANGNLTPPADYLNPVPNFFLVIEKASFCFSVISREQDTKQVTQVLKYVKKALEWLGAGAKTAVGYGRFSED